MLWAEILVHLRSRSGASSHAAVDGESLQADVMRFMAIIGFCLVAIMALVRDVRPPVAQPASSPDSIVVPAPIPEPASLIPEIVSTPRAITPVIDPEPPVVEPPMILAASPMPIAPITSILPTTRSEPEPEPEDGLSLRFHSDRDFLRLITAGDVGLYLFKEQTAFRLAKNYAFEAAPAPHKLYELLPQTIPAAIGRSAAAAVSDTGGFKWGVVMPARIEQRIASLVATQSSGQLVVDRFGSVRHEINPRSSVSPTPSLGGQGL